MSHRPPRVLRNMLRLDDFEPVARRHLPRPIFGYVAGAVEDNVSLRDNRAVFDEWRFVPRVLRNVKPRSAAMRLFGRDYQAPFGIAPMGISALTAYRGDIVQAQAAERAGIPMVLSSSALIRMEDVLAAAPHTWVQVYGPNTADQLVALVERVARARAEVLMLTVDTAVVPNRENNFRAGFRTPLRPNLQLAWDGITHPAWSIGTFLRTLARHGMPHFENNFAERGAALLSRHATRDFGGREHLDWDSLRMIRRQWKGTLVVKGILHPDDARIARDAGADGIVASNHGGRQLDGAVSPMRTLEQIVVAAGDMPVMIDSGFRRGTDVLKALALGARCAFVGRPFNYAAAIAGPAGVDHAIALLKAEIRGNMGMLGINTLAELGPHLLLRAGLPFAAA